jgi:predicted dehydrogenase
VYESYTELLKDSLVDVVHSVPPNDSHAEITIAALESDKHVMCEKPMAKTAADARRMLETAKRTGKKLRENAANTWGPWDPKQFTVEDSAFAMITMENGASLVLESSWALNTLDIDEAKVTLCGTEAGADMKGGLRINGESNSRLYTKEIELSSGGVAFYEGASDDPSELEARGLIEHVLYDNELIVKPEQALVVSEILEAIYESSRTGKAVYFE